MFGWLKVDDMPPDAWTREREQKACLLAHVGGDLDAARREWRRYTGQQFARSLALAGRISEWPERDAPVRELRRRAWGEGGEGHE